MKFVYATALALSFATAASGQQGPGPGEVSVKDAVASGSGCPVGTAFVTVTNSQPEGPIDAINVVFEDFSAEKPGDNDRRFCNVAIDLKFPAGWSYTVEKVMAKGSAHIQEGVTGRIAFETAFRGTTAKVKSDRKQSGQWKGDFNLVEFFDRPAWSPCGKVLPVNIKTTLSLSGKSSERSFIKLSADANHLYTVRWKRC